MGAGKFSIILFSLALLVSCGKSFDGPNEDKIEEFLKLNLPEGLAAEDVEIQAAQNIGDEIEPKYRTRTKLTLVTTEDFARRTGAIGERPIVKIVKEKGEEIPAILFTRSEPIGDDDWNVEQERLEYKAFSGGAAMRLSMFDNYVIEGSDQEKKAISEEKAKEAEEKKRRDAELAEARKAFVGNWKTSKPLMRYGSIYARNGVQVGLSFQLDPGTDGFGTGVGRVYDFNNPSTSAQSKISYTVDDSGGFATVNFINRTQNDAVPFYVSEGTNWRLSKNGDVSIPGNRQWTTHMAR
ncbi:hypothetical protein MB02_01680 [Croceicoccus estronivorus]|uniref:hypothetical protein n=1 Tax=Croceicoccus estronivorus TaxID=1172626 RepID=UPI00082FB10F|nr:hypothetical protein [Croceicoccus estronivorus]OCC25393.1 hypothetical protein MB02_01680 [Croceicoccus estronivorus]